MSLPIIDIHAGDTMSGMVDKINYNFTLLSLKGGGPAGIQGIQGLRGPVGPQGMQGIQGTEGNMIYNVDPDTIDPNDYNLGDTIIYNGIIYQIYWNGTENEPIPIVNLYDSVQSPFGLAENDLHTINPHTLYKDYPFILGIDTGDSDISAVLSHTANDGVLNISNKNLHDFVKFFDMTTLVGTINNINNKLILKGETANGIMMTGGGFTIDIDSNGIFIPKDRINTNYSTSSFIVSTKLSDNGKIDNNFDNAWFTDYSNSCATLFPFKSGSGSISSIGLKTNLQHRIDQICLTKNANVFYDTGDGITEYVSIKADGPSFTAQLTDTMVLSKYGVALGGLKPASTVNSIHAQFENKLFSIKLSTPAQWASNQKYGTMMTITSLGDNTITGMVSSDSITLPEIAPDTSIGNSDWAYRGTIVLSTNTDASAFRKCNYSNLIVADRKAESGSIKSTNDTLHIHGADSTRYAGNDIVVSGGHNLGGSNNNSVVGGDVYLSGGSAFGTNNSMHTDLKRCGNVIIGINPLHHSGCFNSSNFTSTDTSYETNNTSTNPNGVGFFDINNISMHGNRIVIDSNANFRKVTDGYTKNDKLAYTGSNSFVQTSKNWRPYANSPENTTLQISAVNTISHVEPIVIDRKDICSHQFMSGVMRRGIRFTIADATTSRPSKTFVDQSSMNDTFINTNNNSVYFLYEQIWQKIGNIVNVNAFGRWLTTADNSHNLYHIADHFFATSYNQLLGGVEYFIDNNVLNKWLLSDDKSSYLSRPGPYWPMTVFALPVVVENMRSTFCYGNGNVYTEDNMNAFWNRGNITEYGPSGSVLQSAPIVVGAYHRPISNERNNLTMTFGNIHGNRSALYSNATDANEHDNFNCAYHSESNGLYNFMSTSVSADDGFRYVPTFTSPDDESWIENNFSHTELYDNANYCYIYPEMIVSLNNEEQYSVNFSRYSKRTRPCIGMYTWISLNYSYSVMDGFDGEILPIANSWK